MNEVNGFSFDKEFLPKFKFVTDIQYFEGTLLAEYTTVKGDTYIFSWSDCSDRSNRWLVTRVSRRSLYQYTSGLISLYSLFIEHNLDTTFFILDICESQQVDSCWMVQTYAIDSDYLPEEDTFIDFELIPNMNKDSYPILIDNNWSAEDLALFPRKFMDAYALINKYKSNEPLTINEEWTSGYYSQQFYSELKQENRTLGIKSIQYASPGYIEFSANRQIGILVKDNVNYYIENKDLLDYRFKRIENFIRERSYNQRPNEISIDDKQWLIDNGMELMQFFTAPTWDWILENSLDEFRAMKATMSYYRRIKAMAQYISSNQAIFGNI